MKRARHDIEAQGALHPKRLGRFTASSAAKLFMKPATTGYKDAIASVAYERVTGVQPEGSFQGNFWTERGHELEAWAVALYEVETFTTVNKAGFWTLGEWFGASPDGEIEPDGLFEGKAPKFTTHMGYLNDGVIPRAYRWQLVMQMLVCDRDWVDFQSYDEHLPAFRIRAHRDEKAESDLLEQLWIAVEQAEGLIDKLKRGK